MKVPQQHEHDTSMHRFLSNWRPGEEFSYYPSKFTNNMVDEKTSSLSATERETIIKLLGNQEPEEIEGNCHTQFYVQTSHGPLKITWPMAGMGPGFITIEQVDQLGDNTHFTKRALTHFKRGGVWNWRRDTDGKLRSHQHPVLSPTEIDDLYEAIMHSKTFLTFVEGDIRHDVQTTTHNNIHVTRFIAPFGGSVYRMKMEDLDL